jgi:hypothetical protein
MWLEVGLREDAPSLARCAGPAPVI